jgi:hypothetical protein
MKKTLFVIAMLLTTLAYQSYAYVIVIRGGKNNKFYQIILTKDKCSCTGNGNNTCPIDFMKAGGANKTANLGEVTGEVLKFVNDGQTKGEFKFNEFLPVSWTTLDDNSVEIHVDDEVLVEEEYEITGD